MKNFLLTFFTIFFLVNLSPNSFSQLINWQTGSGNPCAGTGNGTMNATSDGACITIVNLCRGTGINSASGGDFNSNGFDTSNGSCADAIADDDCLTWGFTVAMGCSVLENTELEFQLDRSNTGPPNYCLDMDSGSGFNNISTGTISASTGCVNASIGAEIVGPATVTFRLCAWGASSGSGTMDIEDGIASCGGAEGGISLTEPTGPLPVSLASFEATPLEEKSVSLTWQTASEENNDYFSIEHSSDGTNFREIAQQVGNGTTFTIQNYSFLHRNVENGLHYYRLKQVDFDGKFEYTSIVTAKVTFANDDVILTPNPTSDMVLIQTKTPFERDADFQILNMQGQVVLTSVLQEGMTNLELNINDFPVGIYYLQLFVDNEVMMKKIIKQ